MPSAGPEEAIKVVVRIQPGDDRDSCIRVEEKNVSVHRLGLDGSDEIHDFAYDNLFEGSGQEEIFSCAEPLLQDALNGFNVNVFAFGMTGKHSLFPEQKSKKVSKLTSIKILIILL